MFVFREEVSGPQQGLLQLCPVVGPGGQGGPTSQVFPPLLPVVAPLTLRGEGVRLGPPGARDGALIGGGLAGGGGRGDKSAAASV